MLSWHCVGTKCEQLCWNNHHGHPNIKLSCLQRGVQLQIENLSVMSGSMVQFRANSFSFTHIALCDFNLSIVTGKSIVTEGAGEGWFIFPSCCCRATAYFPCQQLWLVYTVEIGRKTAKTPPNKQDARLPGIIITCWACQYNAICSLLSRSAEIPATFVQNSCYSLWACAKPCPSATLPNLMKVSTKEGWIALTHTPGWKASALHIRLSSELPFILPPLCHTK